MYATKNGLRRLKVSESLFFFTFSILLNAAANALTVSANLGSAIWTASAVNLAHLLQTNLGFILALYGVWVIILNTILLREIDLRRIIGNLIFIMPYSYLVQLFVMIFKTLGVPNLGFSARIIWDLVGVVLIGVAVSIYQRVKLVLHPNDDLSYILRFQLRFQFFNGRAAIAQYVSYAMPLLVTLVCWLMSKQLLAINIGTVISLIIQGPITGWSDRLIFPKLRHRRFK